MRPSLLVVLSAVSLASGADVSFLNPRSPQAPSRPPQAPPRPPQDQTRPPQNQPRPPQDQPRPPQNQPRPQSSPRPQPSPRPPQDQPRPPPQPSPRPPQNQPRPLQDQPRPPQPPSRPPQSLAPALPLEIFELTAARPISLEDAQAGGDDEPPPTPQPEMLFSIAATRKCANVRRRQEWDAYSNSDRQAFIDALKCLLNRPPSGQFRIAKNRYEDLAALHQVSTPSVHGNAKFLLWHRYFLWTFEQILRSECSFTRDLPWWDETRYAGRFEQSSVFSRQWFGSVNIGGACVTDGQFSGLTLNIGPGRRNTPHCLARNHDPRQTINTGSPMVNACNSRGSYSDMAGCSEGGAHAWGHNGVGAVMQDVYASPMDPVFWLHHGFIDRNFRIWQNQNIARLSQVDGTDGSGARLTLTYMIEMSGVRPDIPIGDILDTTGEALCYRYNY